MSGVVKFTPPGTAENPQRLWKFLTRRDKRATIPETDRVLLVVKATQQMNVKELQNRVAQAANERHNEVISKLLIIETLKVNNKPTDITIESWQDMLKSKYVTAKLQLHRIKKITRWIDYSCNITSSKELEERIIRAEREVFSARQAYYQSIGREK